MTGRSESERSPREKGVRRPGPTHHGFRFVASSQSFKIFFISKLELERASSFRASRLPWYLITSPSLNWVARKHVLALRAKKTFGLYKALDWLN